MAGCLVAGQGKQGQLEREILSRSFPTVQNFHPATVHDTLQDAFGVRWSGVIGCQSSSVYTFHTLVDADERVRLWVANRIIIDGWENINPSGQSPASQALTGTVELAATNYYPLQLDYWHNKALASGNLKWSYAQSPLPQAIPSTVLFESHSIAHSSVMVRAARPSPLMSFAHSSGVSLATAGVAATCLIAVRDDFGNACPSFGDDRAFGWLQGASRHLLEIPAVVDASGNARASYTTNESGSAQMFLGLAQRGGLRSLYFDNMHLLGDVVYENVTSELSLNWGDGLVTPFSRNYASLRCLGYVEAAATAVYTFHAFLDCADDSAVLSTSAPLGNFGNDGLRL
jgi:hypothetical protein